MTPSSSLPDTPVPHSTRCRAGHLVAGCCRGSSRSHRGRAYIGVFFCADLLVRSALVGNQLASSSIHLRIMDQPDVLHVLLHHRADLGDDAGHVDAASLEVTAAGVEHGFQFFHDEGDVAALAEHGGRSEEHTTELQSLMRNSYAVFC